MTTEISLKKRTDDWLADRRKEIENDISKLKRQEEAFKADKEEIETELMRRFDERGSEGTTTERYTISLKLDDKYPEVMDRDAFEDFVLQNEKLYLLQKRIALRSIREELNLLDQDKQDFLDELEDSNWSESACIKVLNELDQQTIAEADEANKEAVKTALQNRTKIFRMQGKLKEATKEALQDRFSIPGIRIVTKKTITQQKRKTKT